MLCSVSCRKIRPSEMKSKPARLVIGLVAALGVVIFAWVAMVFGPLLIPTQPVLLKFICYTNAPGQTSFVLLEVTNRSDAPYYFTLRSTAKPGTGIWITGVVEPDGKLLTMTAPSLRLEGHSSYKIGADELKSGHKVWTTIKHDPKTSAERQRIGLSAVAAYLGDGHPTERIPLPVE